MRSLLVGLLMLLLVLAAFYLVWLNRASEKLVSTSLSLMIAGLLGAILSVLVFGEETRLATEFPAAFTFDLKTKSPKSVHSEVSMERNLSTSFGGPRLVEIYTSHFAPTDPDGFAIVLLYHHFLQWSLINWLRVFYKYTWDAKTTSFDLPFSNTRSWGPAGDSVPPSSQVSAAELAKRLHGNWFADVRVPLADGPLHLPISTQLDVKPPPLADLKNNMLEPAFILLTHPAFQMKITTRYMENGPGTGKYALLTGANDHELAYVVYSIQIETKFWRLRQGHPDTPKYKAWAQQLTAELQKQFDERVHWARVKEAHEFRALAVPPSKHRKISDDSGH